MSLDRVPAGREVPHDCNAIVEIPMCGNAIKHEVDRETGAVFVDHFFEHYKDLEPGKRVRMGAWVCAEEAKCEIIEAVERHARSSPKPKF